MQIVSPGAFGFTPDSLSHVERVWFPAGTLLLKVGRGCRPGTSTLMLNCRFFEVLNEFLVSAEIHDDGASKLD